MTHLDYLNKNYPTRKSEEEKERFRKYIVEILSDKGIEARVEQTRDGKNKNIVIGDPTNAKAVFTAHYDTPARSLFPNIMIPKNKFVFWSYQFVPVIFLLAVSLMLAYLIGMVWLKDDRAYMLSFLVIYYGVFFLMMKAFKNPNNYNDNTSGVATVLTIIDNLSLEELEGVAFILFDNEEKGKKGSAAYYMDHKDKMNDQFLVNFDCVGNGDHILFIARRLALATHQYKLLQVVFEDSGDFTVEFCSDKEGNSNSDHKNFYKGVGCVACKKTKSGLMYTPSIHTPRDIVANNGNIDFLTKNICNFVRKIR